jgi:hemoglobin-like flavoprotein
MYCIAGFRKVKEPSKFSQMANHNFRLHLTQTERERIDHSRTGLNQVLVNTLGVDVENAGDLAHKVNEHYTKIGAKVKSDSVLGIDLVLTTSPEFFCDEKGNSWNSGGKIRPQFQKKLDDWVAAQLDFIRGEFGANVKLAVLHLDETTPHIHIIVTPEETKELKFKNRFGQGQKTVTSLNADRWNPSYWKRFLTNYEKANKKFGLKKGEENSMSKNVPVKEFSKAVSQAANLDYTKAIEKLVANIGDDLSVVNTKDGVKKLLVEKLLPALNPMLKSNSAMKKVIALDRTKEYSAIKKMKAEIEKTLQEAAAKRDEYVAAVNRHGLQQQEILSLHHENKLLERDNQRLADDLEKQTKAREKSNSSKNQIGGFSQ